MAEGNQVQEQMPSSPTTPEVGTPQAEKTQNTGKVTRRSFIAGGIAAFAGLFGRKPSEANAATPPQNMVAGSEKILGDPGQRMAANAELVRDRGSEMANNQLDVQATPPQNMVSGAENVREEPGQKMADSTLDIQDKGSDMAHKQEEVRMEPGAQMAAGQEAVQDKGSEMAHDQEDTTSKDFAGNAERVQDEDGSGGDDSNTETPSPEIPPANEALV